MAELQRAWLWIAVCALLACSPADAPESSEAARRDIVGTETKRYSQFDEELVIRDFFQDREGGFFLDVGSAQPDTMSTTYYLEKHLGWSGIAVDALARYAPAYEELRPRTAFFSYIVTDHAGTRDKFYVVPGAPGLSSTQEGRVFRGEKLFQQEIEVPTITLDLLLERNGVEKIDFLSMDIEHGAPKALAGFDIEKYRPELVCIEHSWDYDREYNDALLAWFEKHGYEKLERYESYDSVNWYFAPRR
ncbi:MAG: FkbM family methyltransferase [Myxococcota bacterium]|nr:FkbM family methyltransferase [Myxococcota bacterium]